MAVTDPPAEVVSFHSVHPDIRSAELLLPDLNGILRGKRISVREIGTLFRNGLAFPATAQLLDSRGSLIGSLPHGLRDGDPDYLARPVAGSLVPVPWAARPLAQCLASLEDFDGRPFFADPRHLLATVVSRFDELGLTPVVAVEYEFYLLDGHAGGRPHSLRGSVPGSGREAAGPRVYSLEDLHDLDDFFADVTAACAQQGLPAGSIVSEYGEGQFEVNLEHVPDALRAADHALLLRRLIRGVARRHGIAATFMAKPFAELDGSGMHVHVSLLDREGRNVFSPASAGNDGIPPILRHAVGGMLAAMPESFAIFAPNANSYRRIRPDCFAPVSPNWGPNHRHVAIRLPVSKADDARFEHRVAGADCNPYFAIASILAGVHHGIRSRLEPPAMVRERESIDPQVNLPTRWEQALDAFDAGGILPACLGEEFCRVYAAARRFEADAFHAAIPDLDYEWYLPAI